MSANMETYKSQAASNALAQDLGPSEAQTTDDLIGVEASDGPLQIDAAQIAIGPIDSGQIEAGQLETEQIDTGDQLYRAEILAYMRHYEPDIRRFFYRNLRLGHQEADDLIQEVWVRLLLQKHQAKVEDPKNYLFGVARHTLSAFVLRCRRHRRLLDTNIDLSDEAMASCLASGERDIVDALALSEHVNGLLIQLPPAFRAILLAHEGDGYSYEEVAEKLGFSKFTVQIYLKQAKAKLREGRQKQAGHTWREAKPEKRRRALVPTAASAPNIATEPMEE